MTRRLRYLFILTLCFTGSIFLSPKTHAQAPPTGEIWIVNPLDGALHAYTTVPEDIEIKFRIIADVNPSVGTYVYVYERVCADQSCNTILSGPTRLTRISVPGGVSHFDYEYRHWFGLGYAPNYAQVYIDIIDWTSPAYTMCHGDPFATSGYFCDGNAPFNGNDSATIRFTPVVQYYTASGNIFETGGTCTEGSPVALNGSANALVTLTTDSNTYSAYADTNGYYSIPDVPDNEEMQYFTISGVALDGYTLTPACSFNPNVSYSGGGRFNVSSGYYLNADWDVDFGYTSTCSPATHTISGKLFRTSGSVCDDVGSLDGVSSETVAVTSTDACGVTHTDSGAISDAGTFSLSVAEGSIDRFQISNISASGKETNSVCTSSTAFEPGGNQGLFVPTSTYTLNSDLAINFGYTQEDVLADGWYTVIDGDFYNPLATFQITPDAPLGGFTGFLLQTDNFSAFAFGSSFDDVENVSGADRVVASGAGGYVSNFTDSLLPTNFELSGSPATQLTDFENIVPGVYWADVSDLNTRINSRQFYSMSSDGIAVVFVKGEANSSIQFKKAFTNNSGQGYLVLIDLTDDTVTIDADVGTDNPTPLTSQIDAVVITPHHIDVASRATNERTLVVKGQLISTDGEIRFNRNRGGSNNYPSEVVKYDPQVLYKLTKFGRANEEALPGLLLVNVYWED